MKLSEEEPDIAIEEELDVPVAATPDDDLTEDLVDRVVDSDDENDYIADPDPIEGSKAADVVDGVVVEDSRVDRVQIDGAPEDGDSLFD